MKTCEMCGGDDINDTICIEQSNTNGMHFMLCNPCGNQLTIYLYQNEHHILNNEAFERLFTLRSAQINEQNKSFILSQTKEANEMYYKHREEQSKDVLKFVASFRRRIAGE